MTDNAEATKLIVNLDNLTIGDLELFDSWSRGEAPIKNILDVLDRAVEGGVRHLPLSQIGDVVAAIREAVGEASNPKN